MLETEPKIVDTYVKTGRVKLIFRHILDYGELSLLASEAAECAGDQGKFWPMHELLFQRQNDVFNGTPGLYKGWAQSDLKIDANAFGTCLAGNKHKAKVEGAYAAARAAGVRLRPTFDINGKRIQGAVDFAIFKQTIDSLP